ncbi:MAG: hypothetical protein OXT73_01395 [Bacteroidota bacterium]|nr:hypothetical protein [Bacteroidota bacterium]
MSDGILFSAIAGAVLALVYSFSALLLGKVALRASRRTFMMIVMGGMIGRMFVTLIVLALVIVFAPIHTMAFLTGFFVVFVIGLTYEVLTLHRQQQAASNNGKPSA